MRPLERYGAILLVLVFVFPFTFQPVHIFEHHYHPDDGHSSHIEGGLGSAAPGGDTAILSIDEDSCPICQYEFAVFYSSSLKTISSQKLVQPFAYLQPFVQDVCSFNGHNASLRAPPSSC